MLQKRDHQAAQFASLLERVEDTELKTELVKEFADFEEITLKLDMDKNLDSLRKDKRIRHAYWNLFRIFESKHIKTILIAFIAGLIVALIPTLLYINSISNDSLQFRFVPNAIAERKPIYLQMIKDNQDLEKVKKADIYTPATPTIGSAVGLNARGLAVFLKRELELKDTHVKIIPPQESQKKVINGYTYIPDAILTKEPTAVQILENQDQVNAAKYWKNLTYKEYLEIGSAIECPKTIPCYVIGKTSMHDRIIVHPLTISKP